MIDLSSRLHTFLDSKILIVIHAIDYYNFTRLSTPSLYSAVFRLRPARLRVHGLAAAADPAGRPASAVRQTVLRGLQPAHPPAVRHGGPPQPGVPGRGHQGRTQLQV